MAALKILDLIAKSHKTLDLLLDQESRDLDLLSKQDRAFFNAIVFGVLRHRGKLDHIITYFSKTPLKRIQPSILNILRIGLFQMVFMDKVPVSAAVNTSVELSKKVAPQWTVGFVNGLLRNAARHHHTVPFPSANDQPAKNLAAGQSLPLWLSKKWIKRFGVEQTLQLCTAINTPPPITIRCNTLKITKAELLKALDHQAKDIRITNVSEDGIRFSKPITPIYEMNAFASGGFQVQDEAAQMVTLLLNPVPGESVLDACAGLGGKTGHMAQKMRNNGNITAVDTIRAKLKKLEMEMKRIGIDRVTTHVADLCNPVDALPGSLFDRILVDAPCSGLGVLRRNPDSKWSVAKQDLSKNAERQAGILNNLARFLKPGGTMVYSVCSFEPEENEQVIEGFLKNNANFAIKTKIEGIGHSVRNLLGEDGFFRTFPHIHAMDGFFAAVLHKGK